jgi:hypothetical protein
MICKNTRIIDATLELLFFRKNIYIAVYNCFANFENTLGVIKVFYLQSVIGQILLLIDNAVYIQQIGTVSNFYEFHFLHIVHA